jgi:hypothetical protein
VIASTRELKTGGLDKVPPRPENGKLETCEMDTTEDLVAKLDIQPVRQAFTQEAQDFTSWLEQNLDVLGERLGIEVKAPTV